MYCVRRKRDNSYFYYLTGDSVSFDSKMKNAIHFDNLELAKGMKKYVESRTKENCELVYVETTIKVVQEDEIHEEDEKQEDFED